jgi:hypothetical protein
MVSVRVSMNHEPAQRVDGAGDARLVGEDLLGAQRDGHRLLGRQAQRLVHGVRVQALAPAEHAAIAW